MSEKQQYKGYVISPVPNKVRDEEAWTLEIRIWKDDVAGPKIRPFSAGSTFPTREEAIEHCYRFGRQIVDGDAEGLSVTDM